MRYETLDNPVWASLTGTHRRLALTNGRAARYPVDVSPFMGVPDGARPQDWRHLADLAPDERRQVVVELGWDEDCDEEDKKAEVKPEAKPESKTEAKDWLPCPKLCSR